MNLTTTKELAEKYGFFAKKKYGQNFLIDKNIIAKIIEGANLEKSDTVIEIGPGLGALTNTLGSKCSKVICVEIDKNLVTILRNQISSNIEIINGDILKLNISDIVQHCTSIKVVANLPYYIATPIITKLLLSNIKSFTIMVQKEVADRLRASPGTKDYGSLSIFANYNAKISLVTNVSSNCFWPKPNVESSVLHFSLEKRYKPKNEKLFYKIVRQSFVGRRKTMVNCLTKNNGELSITKEWLVRALNEMCLNDNIRSEKVSIEEYVHLSDMINEIEN